MEAPKILNEHPRNALPEKYINVKDKIVLDLGCGFFGMTSRFKEGTMEWEKIKLPDMISTPEYFLNLGAKKVIGIDSNKEDIDILMKTVGNSENSVFINQEITKHTMIEELIKSFNIQIIKCDIEGGEGHLPSIDNEIFKLIDEYYIETHAEYLHNPIIDKLNQCNYKIKGMMTVGDPYPYVIFASKN